jgi:hypothetical protein
MLCLLVVPAIKVFFFTNVDARSLSVGLTVGAAWEKLEKNIMLPMINNFI